MSTKETEGYSGLFFLPLSLGGDVDEGDRGGMASLRFSP